jgi:leucine dehydrogenase
MGGTYVTACDMNISERDMDVIAEGTRHVMGCSAARGGSGSSAGSTAVGVFHGLRACAAHAFGSEDLDGCRIAIQGVGAVGRHLAGLLAEAGASLVLADVVPERAAEAAAELGAEVAGPDEILETPCDVLSPCATGGVLSAGSIPRLRCRVVGGAANNQLAELEDGERFAERGILYAPDYVINAGGIVQLASLELLGETPERLDERLRGIADTLTELFSTAEAEGLSTAASAEAIVAARLASAA